MNLHFYHCKICGKVITIFSDNKVPTVCCGQTMQELIPNTTDGAFDKHVPVFSKKENVIEARIGSESHPMTDAHYISWVGLLTSYGFQYKELRPGDTPEVSFMLAPEEDVKAVYAYCNLHGLWCSDKETLS